MTMGNSHAQVRALLEQALDLEAPVDRETLLAACPNPEVANEVRTLLGLETRVAAIERAASEQTLAPNLPETIGPYRILGLLGTGGMGAVYHGVRDDGSFRKDVAIKVVRDVYSSEQRMRFARERELLARLEHPSIARILDGGTTEAGQPWMAIERIDGVPLDQYVCDRKLPLRERVALMLRIADVVQFAHQNLIVHRDLKPSNVLVQADGKPKLLDFGVAKLLGEVEHTQTAGRAPMTFAYAAPEQIRGDAVTTATDVYALGVMLYELLTGERPHKIKGENSLNLLQAITDTDATAPSVMVSQQSKTATQISAKLLEGDLDTICLKALSRDPARRYQSAQVFADDLQSFLTDRPISARPESASYKLRKWVLRNRALAAMSCVAAIAILVGSAVAWRQAQLAKHEASKANTAARTAVAVSAAMQSLFKAASPDENGGAQLTVREALDLGAIEALNSLSAQPDVQHALRAELAASYENLGEYEQEIALLEPIFGITSQHIAPDSMLRMQLSLAHAYAALDRTAQASAIYQHWLPQLRTTELVQQPEFSAQRVADFWSAYIEFLREQGNFTLAHQEADAWIARERIRQKLGQNDSGALITALRQKSEIYYQEERYPECITVLEEASDIQATVGNTTGLQRAQIAGLLGRALVGKGEPKKGQALLMESLDWHVKVLGDDHSATLEARMEVANQLSIAGAHEPARALMLEVRNRITSRFGSLHIKNAVVLNQLALVDYRTARYASAADGFKTASEIFATRLDPGHDYVLTTKTNLAGCLSELGQASAALVVIDQVLSIRRTQSSKETLAALLTTRGLILEQLDRHELAERDFSEARALFGSELSKSAYAQTLQGRALLRLGKPESALQLLQQSADYYPTSDFGCGPRCAIASLETSRALFDLKRDPSAQVRYAEIAVNVRREKLGADHALTVEAEQWLASLRSERPPQPRR